MRREVRLGAPASRVESNRLHCPSCIGIPRLVSKTKTVSSNIHCAHAVHAGESVINTRDLGKEEEEDMGISAGIKKPLRALLGGLKRWYQEDDETEIPPFENTYIWLGQIYCRCMKDPRCYQRPPYVWGALQGVAAAKALGIPRVSLIEFGVAYGLGALALERVSETLEDMLGIGIDIYGFDTGKGLPKPQDYRDCPNLWSEGYYPLDPKQLKRNLKRTQLKLGLVDATVPEFLKSDPAPIAFMAFDLDFYSSTAAALKVLDAADEQMLPRVFCYFDDIVGFTYGDDNGARLAIREFNESHDVRKVSRIYGLQYYVPQLRENPLWKEGFYLAHLFHHPLYAHSDGSIVPRLMDVEGVFRDAGARS